MKALSKLLVSIEWVHLPCGSEMCERTVAARRESAM
jgi:hypothetical protein